MTPEPGADLAAVDRAERTIQIEVRNLAVGALARERIQIGEVGGLVAFAQRNQADLRCVVWNEERLSLVLINRGLEVSYVPEIPPETGMFFHREEKRLRRAFQEDGPRVWEGEYGPVLFAKKDLVKFLAKHSGGNEQLLESIKTLRVTQRREETEKMLDLESDDVRRTEVETESTNIPRHFTLRMPVAEGIEADVDFEASLYKADEDDGYMTRSEAKTKRIAVRVTNARQVLRGVMEGFLARLPSGTPRYYGRFSFKDPEGRS